MILCSIRTKCNDASKYYRKSLYGIHFKVAMPESRCWSLNDETLGDVIEGVMAVGLNRQDGLKANVWAVRMARAFERSMQLLYALAIRRPSAARNLRTFEKSMQEHLRQR